MRDLMHALAAEHTCDLRAEARRERLVRRESHPRADDSMARSSAGTEFAIECDA